MDEPVEAEPAESAPAQETVTEELAPNGDIIVTDPHEKPFVMGNSKAHRKNIRTLKDFAEDRDNRMKAQGEEDILSSQHYHSLFAHSYDHVNY